MRLTRKKFPGGYKFKNFEGQPTEKLVDAEIPERLIIPLKQGVGNEVPAIVKIGEAVEAGQIVGIDDNSVSNPVHSSVSGVVEDIVNIDHTGKEKRAVVVRSDGTSDWKPIKSATAEWEKLSEEDIGEILYLSGVASLDKAGIPTQYKSSTISPDAVEHIIIKAVGSNLYSSSLNVLLGKNNLSHFIDGLKILHKAILKANIHLAINRGHKQIAQAARSFEADAGWLNVVPLEPRYPQELDEILIPTILGKPLLYGSTAAEIGVVVLSAQTIIHLYETVVKGKPVIERIVALGGMGFKSNEHVKLRIGTTLKHLGIHTEYDARFIMGNPLTGMEISDLSFPIDRRCECIAAIPEETGRQFMTFIRPGAKRDSYSRAFLSVLPVFERKCNTNMHGEERPCISCNFCDEVCPVGILPHLIYRYIERDVIDEKLMDLGPFNCIGCNLCDYVCPSKIPLSKFIRKGQKELGEITGADK